MNSRSGGGPGPGLLVYLGVFAVSGAAIGLEVVLTRILALMLWHHFTYLVIGVALLGLGAAGSLIAARRIKVGEDPRPPEQRLAWSSLWFAIAIPLCYLALTHVQIVPGKLRENPVEQVPALLLIYGLIVLPFLAVGFTICTALSSWSDRVGTVYFADLVGAGVGVGFVALFLERFTGPGMVMVLAMAAAGGALLFGCAQLIRASNVRGLVSPITCLLLAAVNIVGLNFLFDYAQKGKHAPPLAPDKELRAALAATKLETVRWNPIARIEVTSQATLAPLIGGAWGKGVTAQRIHGIFQDGTAPTTFIQIDRDPTELEFLGNATTSVGYKLLEARGAQDVEALVIGVGGGVDLLIALHHRVRRVTGVEINSSTVDLLRGKYAGASSRVAERPDVELVNAEGRHFARSALYNFDIIQISGVDTFTALVSGAQVLSESYVYTKEAIHDFLDKISERGVLSYSRFVFSKEPRETLRLVATAVEVLSERGMREPSRHVFVMTGSTWASLLVSQQPFEDVELEALNAFARENDFQVRYDPRVVQGDPLQEAVRTMGEEREKFYDDYAYQIRPATDDNPFFFNYFKWGNFLTDTKGGEPYFERFPTGMFALLAGLAQTVLLGAILILRPVRGLGREGRGRLPIFLYFAALGIGFIALEIVFMQKLVLFLGHPTWSLTVVLAAMLIAAGIGSLTVTQQTNPRRRLYLLLLLAPASIAVGWFLMGEAIERFLQQPFTTRVVISVVVLFLPSFILGMAFPTGVRIVADHDERLVPWAWAINGFTTVFGSTATVVVAMEVGFSRVVWAIAPLYFVAILCLLIGLRSRGGTE